MLDNILLHSDVYKMCHMTMYPEGTEKIYSYLIARSTKKFPHTVFFGLQYYLKEYMSRFPTHADVDEVMEMYEQILGDRNTQVEAKLRALVDLGYWPIKIEAVPEGAIIPNGNVLATFESTHPDFPWIVGYLESLFLKVWNTCTVATNSLRFLAIAERFGERSCDSYLHEVYQVHDFGYRGCSSEETSMVSGMAHLLSFEGTDTIPAVWGVNKYYNSKIGASVPASEHSVMCAYGRDNEYDAFDRILFDVCPTGIVSVVSDTYNLWNILTDYISTRKDAILARPGKVVFRPDGGNPPHIIAGDPAAPIGSPERAGAIELLDRVFGSKENTRGFLTLNDHVGIIYGEGMNHDRFKETFELLERKGYAASNFVIGIGGMLLQSHNRDDLGFALKATFAVVKGRKRDLIKDPVTSPSKKSHSGLLRLVQVSHDVYETIHREQYEPSGLTQVYKDGKLLVDYTFEQVRERLQKSR